MNKLDQRCESLAHQKLQNAAKRNFKRHKISEKTSCLLIRKFIIVKMSVLPNVIFRCNSIYAKIPVIFFL